MSNERLEAHNVWRDSALPELSIVIVNSDGTADTLRCLDSIFAHPPRNLFEVVLIDNCSQDSCIPLVAKLYPQVRTGTAPVRQGFAKNYNLGIRLARGAFVMILNNDTVVQPNALDRLLAALQRYPAYGMVGPQLVWADGVLQTVCARPLKTLFYYCLELLFLDLALPTGKLYDAYRRRKLIARPSGFIPCISGACMLLARETLEQIGLLDETYDFYFEDIEWCHRVQRAGRQVAYIAEAKVTHFADQSLSKVKVWAKQSEYRGAVRYFRQYYAVSTFQLYLLWLTTLIAFWMRFLAFACIEQISGEKKYAADYKTLAKWILKIRVDDRKI